jgi:hypothetical protein
MKSIPRRRSVRVAASLAILSGLAGTATLVVSSGPSAQADPASQTALVNVGADVTEDVFDALGGVAPTPGSGASNINYYSPLVSSAASGSKTIASFDASPEPGTTTAPGCITTKVGGPSFDRPNSTTAGITALLDAINSVTWENSAASCTGTPVSVTGQIDFARAARGPKTTGSTLTFIPYGRDALGFLYWDNGTANLASLSTSQLQSLYSSATGTVTVGGQTVYACLPISTSSPVTNLESALGLTSSQIETAATAANCNGIQQNSGNSFLTQAQALNGGAGGPAVIPISSGSWIGQANNVGFDRSSTARAAGVDLADITDTATSTDLGKPYTGSVGSEVPNTTYYQDGSVGYDVYTVAQTTKLSGFGGSAALESLFVGSGSAICSSTVQTNIVHKFGFDSLTGTEGTCGSVTTTGNS